MAKRPVGRPRKYPTNADRQRAYRQRQQQEVRRGFDLPRTAAKLRGAIARAKAQGKLPSRPYSVWVMQGYHVITIAPGGYGRQEAIAEAEVTVLMALAARYVTRRFPFGLRIEGAPEGAPADTPRALPAPGTEAT
jgi:hypothetical protein